MGGRGASSGTSYPRMHNPAGILSNAITEDEFLGFRGVGFSSSGYVLDKIRSNRNLKTVQGTKKFQKEVSENNKTYQKKEIRQRKNIEN